jgi:hypothetical protein
MILIHGEYEMLIWHECEMVLQLLVCLFFCITYVTQKYPSVLYAALECDPENVLFSGDEALKSTRKLAACTNGVRTNDGPFSTSRNFEEANRC